MATPPECLRSIVGDKPLQMTFQSSPIDGVEYIGRQWLSPEAALELLQSAEATANANDEIKQREVKDLLVRVASALPNRYGELSPDLEVLARERAEELGDTYARIRMITKGKRSSVHPQMPMDLLGLLILTPG